MSMGLWRSGLQRRAERALRRQLDYQIEKARHIKGREPEAVAGMIRRSLRARALLEAVRPIAGDARVLEVGCGSTGLIFFFGVGEGTGVDPLADQYGKLFPAWYGRARTVAARGESLPFDAASFDIVLCDNVVDHAENPRRILEEIGRVLTPGGLLYFTVNVHHPFYHLAATLHAGWRALGVPFEITPFADHTVHLTLPAAQALFAGLPLRVLSETGDLAELKRQLRRTRGPAPWLKRLFFKNALYEVIAERQS
jgi:SAM-dependent methyltransferase